MIEGRRVRLRPVEDADHPLIQMWQNDPEVWWWMDYEQPFSLQDIAESEVRARVEGHPFIIEYEGRPIGRIGLNQFRRRDRICSLYVFIGDRACWSIGLGYDAIIAFLAHAFERFDLHQVELWSLVENAHALRLYERLGFHVDATLRDRSYKDGVFHDRVILSIQRDEFAPVRERWERGE